MGSSRGYFIIILVPMEGLTDEHLGLGDKLVRGDFHVEGGGALADAACSKPDVKVFRVRCPMLKKASGVRHAGCLTEAWATSHNLEIQIMLRWNDLPETS